jgi:hypothetical protein
MTPHECHQPGQYAAAERAVMDGVWYEPHSSDPRRYVQCKTQSAVLLCAQVVPVEIPDAFMERVDASADTPAGFLLDDSAVSFIARLNLLRFT